MSDTGSLSKAAPPGEHLRQRTSRTGTVHSASVHIVDTQLGVLKAEATRRVWGPKSKILLYIGIALVAYVYSLDGTTTYLYQAQATSAFQQHSSLATVAVATAIILAVTKPIAAKLSDVLGRAEAYSLAVLFYVVGYIVVASCNSIGTYAGGIVIYTFGNAAIQILQQIVIGDMTTLRWRGLVSSLVSVPFFINAFVAGNIAANIVTGAGWRWGYGMFAIIIPAATAPIIFTLFWGQSKAKKLGVLANAYHGEEQAIVAENKLPLLTRVYNFAIDVDLAGLVLFTIGWALVLLPLTIVNRGQQKWSSGDIIAMLTLGPLILIGFGVFEAKVAPKPVFPLRFFRNVTVLACALIGFFDFISFYLQFTYQYSFIYITHSGWSLVDQNYFAYTQTLSLTFFGILAGAIQFSTRRVRWLLIVGLIIRLVAVGAMIKTKGAHGSTFGLVFTQIIQGAGGGIAAVTAQVAAQGSVPHQEMAAVTAMVLLFAEIGGAIGTAIAGAIWKNVMPVQLGERLSPFLNQTAIDGIYGSITTAVTYADQPEIYNGVIESYDFVMTRLLIASTVIAVLPVLCAWFVKDIHLGDTQNAVEVDTDSVDSLPVKTRDVSGVTIN
ncbi:drug:h+ antiporter [Exidia glandulosa HHB12029]|uniref:Drug:h+ antiporter n=1 Tax=Exidia glandulosa HHB12029 TaxID=1314781 RepID=A0A165CHY6_EXIGL|nr:drug:h+ antiporter [Exidia glandulosa HHB12029]